jgi:hypothetical protein
MSNDPFAPNSPLFPWYQPPPPPKSQRSPLSDLLANIEPKPATPSLSDLLIRAKVQPPSFPDIPIQPKPPAPSWDSLFAGLKLTVRARIFVSYQHSSDQYYYDEFSRIFHDSYESIYDNSLRGRIRSDNAEYVIQRIRDDYITGTSCTILLVGPTSYQRKYLDWEVKATLEKEHGLIGIHLPNLAPRWDGLFNVPQRFADNIRSGYAPWIHWNAFMAEPHALPKVIEFACSRPKDRIVNPKDIKKQNG